MVDPKVKSSWISIGRFFGGVIGGFIGIAMVMIVCIICIWVVRSVGSALLGWDLFA